MAMEQSIPGSIFASPNVLAAWRSIADGTVERLVLDPTRLDRNDWAPLLWIARAYQLPVELVLTESSWRPPHHFQVTVVQPGPGTGSCLSWGIHWWEVRHHDSLLPISPRVSWILRALSAGMQSGPLSLRDVNRQLRVWDQPDVTDSNFRALIRAVRERIGSAHIVTVPRRGYLWRPCAT